MIVETNVNGSGAAAMIVDTGSPRTLITPQVAQRLHIKVVRAAAIGGAGANKLPSGSAAVHDVAIGDRHVALRRVIVADLGAIRRAFRFPRLDGVLGRDFFGASYVLVDNERRTLSVSNTPIVAPSEARKTAFFTGPDDELYVDGAIDGVHGDMMIDSGDRWPFTLYERFARSNNFDQVQTLESNAITGYGIGGPIRGNVIATHLSVLGFEIPGVRTRVPLGNAGAFSQNAAIGSIGNGVLKNFNVLYDNAAHEMYVWPIRTTAAASGAAPAVADLPRHGLFGAAVSDAPAGTTATRVLPQTPAAAAGLEAGDVIVSVDSVRTPTVASFLSEMHRKHADERVAFLISRRGATVALTAQLRAPANEADAALETTYGALDVDGSLRRTLVTYPKNATGKLPAVLLIGGIGCYTVDAAANPQDAYMHLARDISRAGFVTMRLEKSGVGDSQGPPCASVDFAAEERGYTDALAALRANPRVDPSHIFLLGHSIGTLEAPRLALSQPVAGVIVAEAVGRDWPEYEVRNLRRQLELDGESPEQVDAKLVLKQQCMQRLLYDKESEASIERALPGCKAHDAVYPVAPPYMQQVAALNPMAAWSKIDVPVLAVYGTSDFVTEEADHRRIVDVVNAHHPSSAVYASIQGMDHPLLVASTPKVAQQLFSSSAARTYDTQFSKVVVDWLLNELKRRQPSNVARGS